MQFRIDAVIPIAVGILVLIFNRVLFDFSWEFNKRFGLPMFPSSKKGQRILGIIVAIGFIVAGIGMLLGY